MGQDRRHFIRTAGLAAAGWSASLASGLVLRPASLSAASSRIFGPRILPASDTTPSTGSAWPWTRRNRPFLTLLHTNDTHARHDPFPSSSFHHAGLGGVLRRARLIDSVRSEGHPVMLLDAGDLFQGTPWFDAFDGELEMRMMAALGYDAVALGNHEFDLGTDGFAAAANGSALTFLCANYDFGNSAMAPFIRPFVVRDIPGGIRVGIFGLGIPFDGNVAPARHHGVLSRDPYHKARVTAEHLRKVAGCDLVIALSHLGYAYPDRRPQDLGLAGSVEGIDLIIGGHTHTFRIPQVAGYPYSRQDTAACVSEGSIYTTGILECLRRTNLPQPRRKNPRQSCQPASERFSR
jgi:5'-nucleotidase